MKRISRYMNDSLFNLNEQVIKLDPKKSDDKNKIDKIKDYVNSIYQINIYEIKPCGKILLEYHKHSNMIWENIVEPQIEKIESILKG